MTRLSKRIRRRKSRLNARLEKEVSRPVYSPLGEQTAEVDPHVLDHLNHFLSTWNQLPSLEGTSLLTQESAREALARFTEVNTLLEERIRTVEVLKRLLTSQKQ